MKLLILFSCSLQSYLGVWESHCSEDPERLSVRADWRSGVRLHATVGVACDWAGLCACHLYHTERRLPQTDTSLNFFRKHRRSLRVVECDSIPEVLWDVRPCGVLCVWWPASEMNLADQEVPAAAADVRRIVVSRNSDVAAHSICFTTSCIAN